MASEFERQKRTLPAKRALSWGGQGFPDKAGGHRATGFKQASNANMADAGIASSD
ncbi:hypothetical protein G9X64_20950 [Rhizobium sophorae]|uniref:Uncharacterized protein n=1 Tax=Rhizobium sophorae TaxID=1535242 RepID=A0A7Y3S879_9HYPH|nr:hypothetical protein [Rhizobium sophorae]NNU38903.1 hypothetical protein [Rhizobium sophorae]